MLSALVLPLVLKDINSRRSCNLLNSDHFWETQTQPNQFKQMERDAECITLLFYEAGEDYVSRRAEFRDAHLEKAWAASARGKLMLGGALANPEDGAVLLFKGDSPEVAENFAKTDPDVTSGTVKRWHVRESGTKPTTASRFRSS